MSDLIAWLRGVLDEDEHRLRNTLGNVLRTRPATAELVAWMYADIAAKRAILDRAVDALRMERSKPGYDAVARLNVGLAKVQAPELEGVVRLLASAYSTRPGYRPEWAPTGDTP